MEPESENLQAIINHMGSFVIPISTDVKIEIITDEKEYKDKGHNEPVVQLYNDIVCVWISCKDLSFTRIEREIRHIKNLTEQYLEVRDKHRQKIFEKNKRFKYPLPKEKLTPTPFPGLTPRERLKTTILPNPKKSSFIRKEP